MSSPLGEARSSRASSSRRGSGGLSRRRVKELVARHQWWDDGEHWWRVREVDVRNGLVVLERVGALPRPVTFGELGRGYRLDQGSEG